MKKKSSNAVSLHPKNDIDQMEPTKSSSKSTNINITINNSRVNNISLKRYHDDDESEHEDA